MAAKLLSPSQIGKLQEVFGAGLRKSNPFSDEAQDLIENSWPLLRADLERACVEVVSRLIQRNRDTIAFEVEVDYDRNKVSIVSELYLAWHSADYGALSEIVPPATGKRKVLFEFFQLDRKASDEEVGQERVARRLVLDPYAQMAINEQNPWFADEHPNALSFRDRKGRWCYIARYWGGNQRIADSYRRRSVWEKGWYFGGTRSESLVS